MKHILWTLVLCCLLLLPAQVVVADDRCALEGHSYSFDIGDTSFVLSGIECTFGPGCSGDCDLWYGNFDTGPLDYMALPFVCWGTTAVIANLPCALTANGHLKCLLTDISGYHRYELGGTIYYVPDKADTLMLRVAPD
jgi:hypothetical protein